MANKWIFRYEEISSAENDLVGKKCANLGEMTSLDMKVPPGFAISVDGYERFMAETGAGEEIRRYVNDNKPLLHDIGKQVEAGRTIRGFIESKPMPKALRLELEGYYAELCDRVGVDDLAVAVRSSGSVSMPGQMETYLNVVGPEDLTEKVIRVWGSAFTTRAIAFRLETGMEMERAPIGVAVMKMVNARCAGVCLTVLPTVGDTSKIVVEGNWGLGESVVSGEITPDQFIVDKESCCFDLTIGGKTKMVCYDTVGICMTEVPEDLRDKPCLTEPELQEIVRVSKRVEDHFNAPQDMEWVIDQDLPFPDSLFWVQTRPAKFTAKKEDDSEYLAELMTRLFKT